VKSNTFFAGAIGVLIGTIVTAGIFVTGIMPIVSNRVQITVPAQSQATLLWEPYETVKAAPGVSIDLVPDYHLVFNDKWYALNNYGEDVGTPGLYDGGFVQTFGNYDDRVYIVRVDQFNTLQLWKLLPSDGMSAKATFEAAKQSGLEIHNQIVQ